MAKRIDSLKYTKDKRAHIPSKEEAGYENASKVVAEGKKKYEIPQNPVVHRGQDPELFWLNKYGPDDTDDTLSVDIHSLYRHEHIAPERLIKGLYRTVVKNNGNGQEDLFSVNELFGNALERDELEKVSEYYSHHDGWTNRLIQGDSLLVMTSLLEREGMAGQVQCVYFDPPYGISYNSNWQMKMNDDLLQEGLLKNDKKAASFVTIGEPDIKVRKKKNEAVVEILGLDIYDGSNFVVSQIFFCGGDKNEFDKWKRGLSNIAKQSTRKQAECTLKIEIDEEAFDRLYGYESHPVEIKKDGQQIAVRVVSQFGEEATKVVGV